MVYWAILSGIEGNLAAYEAVVQDIKRQRSPVSDLYILGDLVGLSSDNEAVVRRVRSPQSGEPMPQVCTGWWEEQCFSLHGIGSVIDAPELLARYGSEAVTRLWESLSRETVQWLRSLNFGFHELDCLLIHGSTVSCSDELTPDTPALQMCDRLIRAEANTLFCGRSGLTFEYRVMAGTIESSVLTLDEQQTHQSQVEGDRRIVGVGNVGRQPGQATYTLYHPGTNQVMFRTVRYGAGKGFQPTNRARTRVSDYSEVESATLRDTP